MLKKRKSVFLDRAITSKKAQVTIFIILGLILLLAVIIIIALQTEVLQFKPEEIIPTQKGKIESYITTCIDEVAAQALDQIGIQGGYIQVPSDIANDASSTLRLSPMHTIPFWAQGTQPSIPSLSLIKERLDQYIEDNLRACVFNREPFQIDYDILEKSPITANTEIVESKIIFNVHWDVQIRNKAGEVITEVIDHITESPIHLKQLHDLATRIIERELIDVKIEDLTQDLLSLEHKNLPIAGLELTCSPKIWKVDIARETLKDMLRVNLNQLQIKGTNVVEYPENLPYYQNHYLWDLGEDVNQKDITVLFNFENTYPFTFQVTPTQGNTMKSSSLGGTSLISFLCLQNWKFTYDASYPVLVKLRDERSGYTFNIAFMVHLIRNQPNRAAALIARPSAQFDFTSDESFCSNRRVPMTITTSELVDNSHGVYNTEPLEEAQVSFTCLKYRCELGSSSFDYAQTGYQAGIAQTLPYCVGGIMRAQKENYKEDWQRVVTEEGKVVDLNLIPLFKFSSENIHVVTHELLEDNTLGPAQPLGKDDLISFHLTFDKNTTKKIPGQPFHDSQAIIGQKIEKEVLAAQQIEFLAKADFTYNLEVLDVNDQTFLGGYKANWTVPFSELENAKSITIHIITKDNPSQDEAAALLSSLAGLSKLVPPPEIKS